MGLLKLKAPNSVPPSGYIFMDPDTKFIMRAPLLGNLAQMIRQHRSANKLAPIDNLEAVVEDFICRHNPPGMCEEKDVPSFMATIRRFASMLPSAQQIIRFSQTIHDVWKRDGAKRVSQQEAERRAAICVVCPNNVSEKMCLGCTGMGAVLRGWLGPLKTSADQRLWACSVCGCMNKLAVHIPLESLKKAAKPGDEYPQNILGLDDKPMRCWRTE